MESPEPPHIPHPPSAHGRGWFDVVFSLCAMVVSVISLISALQQGKAMQELVATNARQASASVWPSIELGNTFFRGQRSSLTVSVQNTGVGPAKIKSFEVLVDGRPVANIPDLVSACCSGVSADDYGLETSSTVSDRVLAADREITVFRLVARPGREAAFPVLDQSVLSDRVERRICYCSVFDECWMLSSRLSTAQPIDACPISATQFRP